MPVTPPLTYPGVYVQEVPSGVRTIVGVGTSIGMFIGASKRGPINSPRRCVSYAAFRDTFGEDNTAGDLANYVRLFFLNGGTDCWVMRIANNAAASRITLRNEAGSADALILTAKDEGLEGENIRAIVTYGGAQPEVTFNMELFTWELQSGVRVRTRREVHTGLSMDTASSSYAPTYLTQNSKLVDAALPGAPAALTAGFSRSGRPVPHTAAGTTFRTAWAALIGNGGGTARNRFLLSIDGSGFIPVDLNNPPLPVGTMAVGTIRTDLATEIRTRIITQFAAAGVPGLTLGVSFLAPPPPPPAASAAPSPNASAPAAPPATETSQLQIRSSGTGDVFIRPATSDDLAVPLMLGAEQGGLEVASHAARRPAPNGISMLASDPAVLVRLANLAQSAFTAAGMGITLDQTNAPPLTGTTARLVPFADMVTTNPAHLFYRDGNAASPNDNNDGLREKVARMAADINNVASGDPLFRWTASAAGPRLTILPTELVDDNFLSVLFDFDATVPVPPPPVFNGTTLPTANANFIDNVKVYTLGAGGFGIGGRQVAGVAGSDGTAPTAGDYDNAYLVIDSEVDLFNLMVLPPVASPAVPVQSVYGNASVFCLQKRAFLLMDPPDSWVDPQAATAGLTVLRTGLVKDYSAVFFPKITIQQNGLRRDVGPSGALAGLFGRIDSTRGVWKAPAGTEADLRGIVGLQMQFSDRENGILNPRAINTLRIFPSGIVNWGARTNQGDDSTPHDYKYIPIRRLALFIEESLYRGLKWVVFEPNDEPLWSQIRLNVGAFMHNLFRQGAFQGRTPKEAYFVKCDAETTTQNDRNLGIVNIWVGFAPLKPAEFVILYLQQMAGQIET